MFVLVASALAVPPLPTWSHTDVEVFHDRDASDGVEGPATPSGVQPTTRALDVSNLQRHRWSENGDFSVELSGRLGSVYYVTITVRGPGLVAHWMQGPFAGEDQTTWVSLAPPAELLGPMEAVGTTQVTTIIQATDFDGAPLYQSGLALTAATITDGRVQIADNQDPDETITDEEFMALQATVEVPQ